jgi:hypothetical protein
MYYRLVRFELGPDKLDAAKAIFADLVPDIKSQPGCKSVVAFGDKASGAFGFSVIWETSDASENAKSVIGPKLSKHLADNNASSNPFSSDLFEIFD